MLIALVTLRHALWLTTCRNPMLSPHSYKKQEFTYGILRLESLYSQITFCWWRKMPLMRKHRVDYLCAAVISYPHYTYKHYLLLILVIISKWQLNNCCLIPTWLNKLNVAWQIAKKEIFVSFIKCNSQNTKGYACFLGSDAV